MTIADGANNRKIIHTASGATSTFLYPFKIFDESDLDVYFGDDITTESFIVAGVGNESGGAISFQTPPALGTRITIVRTLPLARDTDFQQGGDFRAADLNTQLDKLVAMLQQNKEEIDRAPKVPVTSDESINDFPSYQSGKVWVWGESGALENYQTPIASIDATAASALTTANTANTNAISALNAANEALAVAQEPLGTARYPYEHTLVTGTQTYTCAPAGRPWVSVDAGNVYIDGVKQRPTADYTLEPDGLSITLVDDVVAAPGANEWAAGQILSTEFQVVGLSITNIPDDTISTAALADDAVTAAKLADNAVATASVQDGAITAAKLAEGAVNLRGFIAGLTVSNSGSDADHDLIISPGVCTSDDGTATISITSALTKQVDAAWAAGNNQGGLDAGTVGSSASYHIWAIKNPTTGVSDALISASASSPTLPSGFTKKRRIVSRKTDGSANWVPVSQWGDKNLLLTPVQDVNGMTPTTSASLLSLSVPSGVKVEWFGTFAFVPTTPDTATAIRYTIVTSPDQNDVTPSSDMYTLAARSKSSETDEDRTVFSGPLRTNTSGQIRARSTSAATVVWDVITCGWIDRRGKDD